MPIGELIGEILVRGVLEIVFYAVFYYTGVLALWILTFGQLTIAPLSSIETVNKGKNRWTDWSIWLHRPFQGRVLKAECACFIGLLVWIGVGASIYFSWNKSDSKQPSALLNLQGSHFLIDKMNV